MSQELTRRSVLSLFVVAGAGAALAACSTDSGGNPGPTIAGSPIPTTVSGNLSVWNFSSQLTDAINTKYIPSQPGLKVDLTTLGQADLFQRLLVALAAGSGLPGVATLSSRTADQYLKTGSFASYTDGELAPMIAAGLDSSALVRYKGKAYGIPLLDGRMAMWVNNATLEKRGIDLDSIKTFEALGEAGRKLKQDSAGKSHLFMVPQGTNGADFFSALAASAGQNWFDPDGKVIEDQSLALSTLKYVVGLVKDGVATVTDWTQPGFYDLLKQEQLTAFGMNYAVGASNIPKNVPDQSGQWRMLNWPAWGSGKRQTVSYGETFFGVLTNGGNVDAGKNFASWWLTDGGLASTVSAFGTVPSKAAADLAAAQAGVPYFGGQKVLSELMSVPMVSPNYLNWTSVQKVVSNAIDQAVLGKTTPEQAIDSCITGLKAI